MNYNYSERLHQNKLIVVELIRIIRSETNVRLFKISSFSNEYHSIMSRKPSIVPIFCEPFDLYPTFFINTMKILSFITTPINVFGIYLIICKSTQQMKYYRWHLLNNQLWSSCLENLLLSGVTPVLFLPHLAGYSAGYMYTVFNIPSYYQIVITFLTFSGTLCSIIQLFWYRRRVLLSVDHPQHYSDSFEWCIRLSTYAWYLIPVIVMGFLNYRPRETSLRYFEVHTCLRGLSEIPNSIAVFANPEEDVALNFLVRLSVLGVITMVCVAVAISSYVLGHSFIILESQSSNLSALTLKLQKTYIICLIVQITVPIVLIAMFGAFLTFSTLFYFTAKQGINQICLLGFSLHGTCGTITMTLVNKPYRLFVTKIFRKKLVQTLTANVQFSGISSALNQISIRRQRD